jgi:hypothetical protein
MSRARMGSQGTRAHCSTPRRHRDVCAETGNMAAGAGLAGWKRHQATFTRNSVVSSL